MKKKVIAIILALAMVLTLAGCGGSGGSALDGSSYGNTGVSSFSNITNKACIATTGSSSYSDYQAFPQGGYVYKADAASMLLYGGYLFITTGGDANLLAGGYEKMVTVGGQRYGIDTVKNGSGTVLLTMLLKDADTLDDNNASNMILAIYPGNKTASFQTAN